MRELALTVPSRAVEDVLDRLLPIVPGGVREVQAGRRTELRMRGAEIPDRGSLAKAAGRWPHTVSEREVPDDWRERRIWDYAPDLIGGRLVVAPDWAPASSASIEIALGESAAFGAGAHPTTRTCLELLLELEAAGSFADLGCGTGVLAILAVRLGWEPVSALDVRPEAVAATAANAERNAVSLEVLQRDLAAEPPPAADGLAANFPAELHRIVAPRLPEPLPRVALLSGFGSDQIADVLDAYAARGLRETVRREPQGWVVTVLKRD